MASRPSEEIASRRQRRPWINRVEAKYGLPLELCPGMVYCLHYDPPRLLKEVGYEQLGNQRDPRTRKLNTTVPNRHYVGWTQQADPRRRIRQHAPMAVTDVVYLEPGTITDEWRIKVGDSCPRCQSPYLDSLEPAVVYAVHLSHPKWHIAGTFIMP